jgi:hypothetical protein
MTTTVASLIAGALKDIEVLGEGETASTEQGTDALALLNQMLALWQTQNVYVYAQQVTSFSPDGAASYTVGTSQDVNMTRPERIDQAYWRSGTTDYPITLLPTFQQYQAISDKTETGEPLYAFYLPSYTTGTLYLYPQPSTGSVYLVSQVRLPQPSSATSGDLTLPPEYMLPVRANLALLLAPMFGKKPNQLLVNLAANSLRLLRRNNLRLEPLALPASIPTHNRATNILSGY